MNLGSFSLSLAVQDIKKSEQFYQALGFATIDGGHINTGFKDTEEMKWRILENDSVKIGLFQGMFSDNMLTFNTSDIEKVQQRIKKANINLEKELEKGKKSGTIMLKDPDGNTIMFDQ